MIKKKKKPTKKEIIDSIKKMTAVELIEFTKMLREELNTRKETK